MRPPVSFPDRFSMVSFSYRTRLQIAILIVVCCGTCYINFNYVRISEVFDFKKIQDENKFSVKVLIFNKTGVNLTQKKR